MRASSRRSFGWTDGERAAKSEARYQKAEGSSKPEARSPKVQNSDFGIRISFGLLISDFGFVMSLGCYVIIGCQSLSSDSRERPRSFAFGKSRGQEVVHVLVFDEPELTQDGYVDDPASELVHGQEFIDQLEDARVVRVFRVD
jgi:hypothetical protein